MHGFQNVDRRTDSHQVSDFIFRSKGLYCFNDVVHFFCGLPYCQSANGIAVQPHCRNILHMLYTDILIGAALIDAEQQLMRIDGII